MTLRLVSANLVEMEVDAIVNAANNQLARGGGVCGAIFKAAGAAELSKACDAIGHCPTGKAVITPGFNLKAKRVIHTVGPVWHGGSSKEPELLRGCYKSSLALAEENGLKSIAFPLISAGIFGYPRLAALLEAINGVREFYMTRLGAELGLEDQIDVQIVLLGDRSDFSDPDLTPEKKIKNLTPPRSSGEKASPFEIMAEAQSKGFGRHLALDSNLKVSRLSEIIEKPESIAPSELLAIAVGLAWDSGKTMASFEHLKLASGFKRDWDVAAFLMDNGRNKIDSVNRNLFALGFPGIP